MTTTDKYKRAEALFNDRTKRELADMVVHREADLEDAKAENAKLQNDADLLRSMLQAKRKDTHALMSENAELRETLQRRTEQFEGMTEMWAERGAENAKLREYAKLMHGHIKDSCDVCDEYYCSSWDEDNECCVFDSYMRELGVEVGDG